MERWWSLTPVSIMFVNWRKLGLLVRIKSIDDLLTDLKQLLFLIFLHICSSKHESTAKLVSFSLKETRNSFKSDLWIFDGFQKKPLWKLVILKKTATFKSFLHLNPQLLFLWQWFLIFLTRKTLTNDLWELHKNMNCAFPLKSLITLKSS